MISVLVPHPENGFISMSLRAMLYTKKEDIQKLHKEGKTQYRFKMKHTMAVELIRWASEYFRAVRTIRRTSTAAGAISMASTAAGFSSGVPTRLTFASWRTSPIEGPGSL